jgi:chromosome segregation ATPase
MGIRVCGFSRRFFIGCLVFMTLGTVPAKGQQEDVNNGDLLIAKIAQLESKIRIQDDILRRARERIGELERQLAQQKEQNDRFRLLYDKAGIKTTAIADANFDPNKPGPLIMDTNLSADDHRDSLRVERLQKKIKEMNQAIELDEKRIEHLPPIPRRFLELRHSEGRRTYYGYYRLRQGEFDEIRKALDTVNEHLKLLADEENNYNQILHYAVRNANLGIDDMEIRKKLIECQGRKEEAGSVRERLQDVINANRGIINFTQVGKSPDRQTVLTGRHLSESYVRVCLLEPGVGFANIGNRVDS